MPDLSDWGQHSETDGSGRALFVGAVCCILAVLLMVCYFRGWVHVDTTPPPTPTSTVHAPRPR